MRFWVTNIECKKKWYLPKKPFLLVFPYLELFSLQTRTKLRKMKIIYNCCRLQILFNSQNILANAFRFKDWIPKELTSGVVYKFQSGFCSESYYGGSVRDFIVKIGEDIGISPLLSLRAVLLVTICYSVTILHLLMC